MNRKLLSLVLAAVFTVSLGTMGFSAYEEYANAFNAHYGGADGSGRTHTYDINDAKDVLGGNITQVFGYYGGSLVSVKGANGSFTLYDSYGPRFSVSNKGDIWEVTGVELRTSDLEKMKQYDTAEAFFKTMGYNIKMTDMTDTDSNGNQKGTTAYVSKEWWDKVKSTLSKGANYSISISAGSAATGPLATINENGKRMQTFQTNNDSSTGIKTVATYYYDSRGFLIGQGSLTEEGEKSANGQQTNKYKMTYTAISYDKNGVRTDTTYKLFNWSNNPAATIQGGLASGEIPKAGSKKTGSVGEITSVTKYSANNSTLYSKDYTNNQTTYYANGQQSYTVDDKTGETIDLYSYTSNGIATAHFNANGTDSNGNKVGTTTLYDKWGREAGKVNGGLTDGKNPFKNASQRAKDLADMGAIVGGTKTAADLAAQYDYDESKGQYKAKAGTGTRIQSVNIYADQILNTNNPAIMTNGFIDMNKVHSQINAGNLNSILKSNGLSGMGYTNSDIKRMLKFSQGGSSALAISSIQHSTWDGDNIPGKSGVTGSSDYSNVKKTSTSKTVTTSASFGSNNQGSTQKTESNTKTCCAGVTFNNTILFGGAQAYVTTHHVVTQQYSATTTTNWVESDPAVSGQLWSPKDNKELVAMANKLGVDINDEKAMADLANGFYTDANGQTYAILAADSINIMDGKGFHSAEGETMLVAIDSNTKAQIEQSVASGDRTVMFMGDVRPSAAGGFLTIAMNTSYGGGFVGGSAAVEAAKADITQKSQAVAQAREALEKGDISQADYDSIVKSAGWVGNNTDENLDKFAKGNYSWDDNKTALQNMQDAFDILLNF